MTTAMSGLTPRAFLRTKDLVAFGLDTVSLLLTAWVFTLGGKHFSDNGEEKQSVEKWKNEFFDTAGNKNWYHAYKNT